MIKASEQVPEGCDLSSELGRTVWSVFDPNELVHHKEITREEFERLYLCQWGGGYGKVESPALK